MFNTVKQKLLEGKQVIGGTIVTADPKIYLAMANAGFDFIWIEMQHSPMSYQDAAAMRGWSQRSSYTIYSSTGCNRGRYSEGHRYWCIRYYHTNGKLCQKG